MLLRSKIVRNKPGVMPPELLPEFVVELGAKRERQYLFKLDKHGDHVCDVKDPADAAHLLGIKEGYEIHPSAVAELEKASEAAKEKADIAEKARLEYEAAVSKMKRPALVKEAKRVGISDDEIAAASDDALRARLVADAK